MIVLLVLKMIDLISGEIIGHPLYPVECNEWSDGLGLWRSGFESPTWPWKLVGVVGTGKTTP